MLSGLRKRFRIKAAILIAVAYAVCVLAPATALAFADSPSAFHCLSDLHGVTAEHDHAAPTHVHADGTAPQHTDHGTRHQHSDADGKGHIGNCCGLFCMTALAHEPGVILAAPMFATPTQPSPVTGLAGRGPDRIIRPPIA